MNRTLSRIVRGALVAGALFAAACGGGGSDAGPTSADFNKDPQNFIRAEYTTIFRALAGQANGEEVMRLFEESCRAQVSAGDVNAGIKATSNELNMLKGAKIEDFDFQSKLKVNKTDKGATVTVPGPGDVRIKVDGKWLNAFDYFSGIGFLEESDRNDSDDFELVLVNGRYYDSECDTLTDIAEDGRKANATPTPARSTATPARTTPTATAANRTPTPSATTRASAGLSNSDVESYAKRYWLMVFGVYTGNLKADDVLQFYTSQCRSQVRAADVTTGLNRVKSVYPKLNGEKLEDMDFGGKFKITPISTGFQTELPGARDLRVKVNGQWQDGLAYFRNAGLVPAGDSGAGTTQQDFVVQDGKLYDADCVFLKDLAG